MDGTPHLALFIGDGDSAARRAAEHRSGSGINTLTFRYTVQAGDIDHDGMSVGAGATSDDRPRPMASAETSTPKARKRRLITRPPASRMLPSI